MSLVGRKFPNLSIDAMDSMGDTYRINVLNEAVENQQKVLLFWYPKDFTFVCPTELHAFQEALESFRKKNTIVIGASCDTPEVHFAWLNTPKDQGGIEGVTYPILADTHRLLSSALDILDADYGGDDDDLDELEDNYELNYTGGNVTYRATYLIDETGKVFHESINDMPVGRNVQEYLRIIDAYAHVQKHGEVCPANWQEGKDAMQADRKGVANYLSTH